ncbi:hypothetical protein, partial [Pseudomonas syringae group genomosp. 7]|uniref:hypothetical protein n=1 Tax=Pseudomonas syringae group genomosp. 7 TaxID=251699 RepID=UPI003770126B
VVVWWCLGCCWCGCWVWWLVVGWCGFCCGWGVGGCGVVGLFCLFLLLFFLVFFWCLICCLLWLFSCCCFFVLCSASLGFSEAFWLGVYFVYM